MRLRFAAHVSPGDLCEIHRTFLTAERGYEAHSHDYIEVFWIEAGTALHQVNNERMRLETGSLVILGRNDHHHVLGASVETCRYTNVMFARAAWQAVLRRHRMADLTSKPVRSRTFHLDPAGQAEVSAAAVELWAGKRDRRAVERFLLNLFYLIETRVGEAGETMPEWLATACHEIRAPSAFRRGPSAFVELCERTHEHVAREARRWLGKTPTDIVNDARLDHVVLSLRETEQPLLHIAFDTGFDNPSYLYRLFRQRFGTTPGRFRARARLASKG
jgi:AraC family cel operon transcriptional repressor